MEVKYGGIYLYDPPKASGSAQAALLTTSGSEKSGMRPFVIVSRDTVNQGKPTAVGVPLTTKTHKANSYRIALPAVELIRDVMSDYKFSDIHPRISKGTLPPPGMAGFAAFSPRIMSHQ
jgi:mRNA-degrading endonuclease toxin of MazEF toxin-antitoxin module